MALRENPKKAAASVTLRSGFVNIDGAAREVAFKFIVPQDTVKGGRLCQTAVPWRWSGTETRKKLVVHDGFHEASRKTTTHVQCPNQSVPPTPSNTVQARLKIRALAY